MLANYVGEEAFTRGVSLYLKKHLYSNAVTKDLWDGISEATGRFPLDQVYFLGLTF
jgi:aminopeptidase 2